MQTKVSTRGQIMVPISIGRKLGLKSGDKLDADIRDGNIVLTPSTKKIYKTWIGKSPITGFPVLMAEEGAPKLTSEQVAEMLSDFP